MQVCDLIKTYGKSPKQSFKHYPYWRAIAIKKQLRIVEDTHLEKTVMLNCLSVVWYPAGSYPLLEYIKWFQRLLEQELLLLAILMPEHMLGPFWEEFIGHELDCFIETMTEYGGRLCKDRPQALVVALDIMKLMDRISPDMYRILQSKWKHNEYLALKFAAVQRQTDPDYVIDWSFPEATMTATDEVEAEDDEEIASLQPLQKKWKEAYVQTTRRGRKYMLNAAQKLCNDGQPVLSGCAAWRGCFELTFILKELEMYRHVVDLILKGPWGTAKDSNFVIMNYGQWVNYFTRAAEKGLHKHARSHFDDEHERACFLMNTYRHLEVSFRYLKLEGADFTKLADSFHTDAMSYTQVFKWAVWKKPLLCLDVESELTREAAAKAFEKFTESFEIACESLRAVIVFDDFIRSSLKQMVQDMIVNRYALFYHQWSGMADFSRIKGGRNSAIKYEPATLSAFLEGHLEVSLSSVIANESEENALRTTTGMAVADRAGSYNVAAFSDTNHAEHTGYVCENPFTITKEPVTVAWENSLTLDLTADAHMFDNDFGMSSDEESEAEERASDFHQSLYDSSVTA
eukprot:TRINITY_DN21834_c0_g1_i4.p1 TRINITY_DN21834_c0_g1~~TRINITY_DN21834_c0_g1_i4.p1  ORF type:complete len:572 (-),score=139.59 TRINITY_DN21834_c0_g1_i4:175-1890(-)